MVPKFQSLTVDPGADTYRLVLAAVEIQNADAMLARYENLLTKTSDPRLRRHYGFCIEKANRARAQVVAGINI